MKTNILIVDDNPGMVQLMGRILSSLGSVRFATNGAAALAQARESTPDLVLLDAEMPGMNGFRVCEAMKDDARLREVPVIFVTSHTDPEFELKGLDLGAVDFIAKPISEPLLMARVQTHLRLKRLADELRNMAAIDSLTDVANLRLFDQSLEREWHRGLRVSDPICVVLIDVDHLRPFNERYGHLAGDDCLRAVARTLRRCVNRPADLVARFDSGSFALMLPQTTRVGAEHVSHRVLDAVEALDIAHDASPIARRVTASIGIGCYDHESACWLPPSRVVPNSVDAAVTPTLLIDSARAALRQAKQGGRAQAWLLDIGHADSPTLAQEIDPRHRDAAKIAAA